MGGMDVDAFRASPASGRGAGRLGASTQVRAGSKQLVDMTLKAKSRTYIGGTAEDMGQFGKKITVTGSI